MKKSAATPSSSPIRALIATNIPAPYRIPVYEALDDGRTVDLSALYFADRESNRDWVVPSTRVRSLTLRALVVRWRGRYIHLTRGVWRALAAAQPEVVVTTGFNPAHLTAFAYCIVRNVPHVVQTDGTIRSEASLSVVHRLVRRAVARRSAAFVAASAEGEALLRTFGATPDQIHSSPLATDNERFAAAEDQPRNVDVLFVGQFTEVKNPLFAIRAAQLAARRSGTMLRMALVGSGPLRDRVIEEAARVSGDVEVHVVGFQQQDALAGWYRRSRVFLFPTSWDPWGLVANEAAAAGVPVIVSPHAGCGGELIRDGQDGFVVPLDLQRWAERIALLLNDREVWSGFSASATRAVGRYTFTAAADGLRAAIVQAAATASSGQARGRSRIRRRAHHSP